MTMALSELIVMNSPSMRELMPISCVAQSEPKGAMNALVRPTTKFVAQSPRKAGDLSSRRPEVAFTVLPYKSPLGPSTSVQRSAGNDTEGSASGPQHEQ